MTMTTGEFDYDSIFRQFPGGAGDDDITREIPYPPLSYVLWMMFLVMMPILLTNLLVCLIISLGRDAVLQDYFWHCRLV